MNEHFLATLPHLAAAPQDAAKSGLTYAIFIAPEAVRQAATLCRDRGYHLEDVTVAEVQEGVMVLYHYNHFDAPGRISVMALTTTNTIDTVSDIHSGADWHERECFDFYGTAFTGHPNLLPILLPPDSEVPPLKKSDATKAGLATLFPWATPQAETKEV